MGNERIEGASYMPEQAGVDTWLKVLGLLWVAGAAAVAYIGAKVRKIRDHDEQLNALGKADDSLQRDIAEMKRTAEADRQERLGVQTRLFDRIDEVKDMMTRLASDVARALALQEKHK
jgi:hypothetical protein